METALITQESDQESASLVDRLLPELPDYLDIRLGSLTADIKRINARVFTAEEKAAFVRYFVANRGAFLKSCEKLKADPNTVYDHLRRDPAWAAAVSTAKLSLGEGLQSHLHHLAMKENGTLATLALLRNRYFPKVYRESSSQINVGVAIQFNPSA